MRVSELIALLQTVPPDRIVVVDGSEAGLTEEIKLKLDCPVRLHAWNRTYYYGEHEVADYPSESDVIMVRIGRSL